jgi:hypothetical protein
MIEFAVETRHENVQIGLQRVQVAICLRVDFADHACIEVVRIHGLRANREDSVEDGNVHVSGLLGDAVKRKEGMS